MIISGDEVIGKKIVHMDNDEKKSEVEDILMDKEGNVAYLSFGMDVPVEDNNAEGGGRPFDAVTVGSGNPVHLTPELEPLPKMARQLFFIPREQIERMTANAVIMKGTEIEEERLDQPEVLSYLMLRGRAVETGDGEPLGKIKDLVLEERDKKVIGLKLSEGFWEKLIGDGTKYMPYGGIKEWTEEKIIVASQMADQLVDEREQLV
ncbi:MAG TPA: PRC-barrel domain-containing protein [Bacillales bacterium]|nr:PRC-barrel domain-containing protein [Bacillales bacterium]